MPVLDATKIEEETEITESANTTEMTDAPIDDDAHRVRTITLSAPATCETEIVLLVQHGSDGMWRSGYRITRQYDSSPHDRDWDETPLGPEMDEGYDTLGQAVCYACEQANYWISVNQADEDAKGAEAGDYLDSWLAEFEPETATEAIFDDGPDPTEAPTAIPLDADVAAGTIAEPETIGPAPSAAPAIDQVHQAEEHRDHEAQKRRLEERISQAVMARITASAAMKSANDAVKTYGEELAELERAWARRLPLFDTPIDLPTEIDISSSPPLPVSPAPGAPEPWRAVKLADLDSLTPKILEILEAENIRTIGDWVNWPAVHQGLEYTQIANSAGKITENRFQKIQTAMTIALDKTAK